MVWFNIHSFKDEISSTPKLSDRIAKTLADRFRDIQYKKYRNLVIEISKSVFDYIKDTFPVNALRYLYNKLKIHTSESFWNSFEDYIHNYTKTIFRKVEDKCYQFYKIMNPFTEELLENPAVISNYVIPFLDHDLCLSDIK